VKGAEGLDLKRLSLKELLEISFEIVEGALLLTKVEILLCPENVGSDMERD
jgi:hypothetical protein